MNLTCTILTLCYTNNKERETHKTPDFLNIMKRISYIKFKGKKIKVIRTPLQDIRLTDK